MSWFTNAARRVSADLAGNIFPTKTWCRALPYFKPFRNPLPAPETLRAAREAFGERFAVTKKTPETARHADVAAVRLHCITEGKERFDSHKLHNVCLEEGLHGAFVHIARDYLFHRAVFGNEYMEICI